MTRLLTAIAIILPLLLVLWLPWQAFGIAVALVGLLSWSEYVRLAGALGPEPVAAPGGLLVLAVIGAFALSDPGDALLVIAATVPLAGAAALRDGWHDPRTLASSLGSTLAGLAWIGLLLGCQLGVRREPEGALWLLLLYAAVAVGDSAAYYGGTAFGRRKLSPALSPKKTLVGTGCGLVGSALAAAGVALWLSSGSSVEAVALGLLLGAVGQGGDLIESALKRAAGVKDSSTLLPGHGGVLDRIDGHLTAGGVLFVVLRSGLIG